jgi:hypothetical protein
MRSVVTAAGRPHTRRGTALLTSSVLATSSLRKIELMCFSTARFVRTSVSATAVLLLSLAISERPADDEVQRLWDKVTAEARSRWQTLREQIQERRRKRHEGR